MVQGKGGLSCCSVGNSAQQGLWRREGLVSSSTNRTVQQNRHCWYQNGIMLLILCCPHASEFIKSSSEQANEILPKSFENAGSI